MSAKPGSDGEVTVAEYVARFPPEIKRLIQEVRKVTRSIAPDRTEKAYRGWPMRVFTDRGSIAIAGFREHVNVNLGRGATLRDPHRLLEGTGKSIRHVKVRSVADARSDGVRDLIAQELRGGPARMSHTKGEGKKVFERVRKICLRLPDVTERPSHGTPTFFARGKQFAQVWSAHHEDAHMTLWCAAPSGAQRALVSADPQRFFVPPYVGHRGWIGVRLDRKVNWAELERIIDDAYGEIAPGRR